MSYTPIQLLNMTTKNHTWQGHELLEVITQATTQIDGASGWDTESDRIPTAEEILEAIHNALQSYYDA